MESSTSLGAALNVGADPEFVIGWLAATPLEMTPQSTRTVHRARIFRLGWTLVCALQTTLLFAARTEAQPVDESADAPPAETDEKNTVFLLENDDDGEVIDDPELRTGGETSTVPTAIAKSGPTVDFVPTLHTRLAVDTTFDNSREDVFEGLQLMSFEATVRRSEKLRFGLGLRARFEMAARRNAEFGDQDRYALDVVPTAAYADATLCPGVHLRAGYQGVPLGRFDVFGATSFLSVNDFRSGPLMPVPSEIAQPALRLDLDGSWLSLTTIYLPFFQPHLVSVVRSDYSLFELAERQAATVGGAGASRLLERAVERSAVSTLSNDALRTLGPEPNLEEPQAAMRATARSGAGEISVTAGTALERLPAVIITPALDNFLTNPTATAALALLAEPRPLRVEYNRFGIASVDAATDVGPVQIGIEGAYMVNRTLVATGLGANPTPAQTDLLHTAVRFDFVSGTEWLVGGEAFFTYALDRPGDPRLEWITLEDGRFWSGGAALVRWAPGNGPVSLEVAGLGFTGQTWLAAPRIEWRVVDELALEAGAFLLGGPAPRQFGIANISIGGIYRGNDQVFLGMKWLP